MTVDEIRDGLAFLAVMRAHSVKTWRRVLLDERERRMAHNQWS